MPEARRLNSAKLPEVGGDQVCRLEEASQSGAVLGVNGRKLKRLGHFGEFMPGMWNCVCKVREASAFSAGLDLHWRKLQRLGHAR